MTYKNAKTFVFFALVAVTMLSASVVGMAEATPNENASDKAKEKTKKLHKEKPETSTKKKSIDEKVFKLFDEEIKLKKNGEKYKNKYDKDGADSLTSADIAEMDKITKRLKEINVEKGSLQKQVKELLSISTSDLPKYKNALKSIKDADIPRTSMGIDRNSAAIYVTFETEELEKKYISEIEKLIEVPFYTDVQGYEIPLTVDCVTLTSNCDPIMGGVRIESQYSSGTAIGSGNISPCSYSIPAERDVWWWTDYGFVTAGHCFSETHHSGNDVYQATVAGGEKIGDLSVYKYDTENGECDCAFVKKSGSTEHWHGVWNGANTFHQLTGKSDPQVNDYVYLVGATTGTTKLGQVVSLTHESVRGNPVTHTVENTVKINYVVMQRGDSGGTVYDWATMSQYNGLISTQGSDYTTAIPYSHIKAGLDLN